MSDTPPPLRPLVFTEASKGQDQASSAAETSLPQSPEDLGVALYQALVEYDRVLFEALFVSPEEWAEVFAPLPEKKTKKRAKALARASKKTAGWLPGSEKLWVFFNPGHTSEALVGGLKTRLELLSFDLDKGHKLSGEFARPDEQVDYYGENRLRLRLKGTKKVFTLRVPRIIRIKSGWKVASKIKIDSMLKTYLQVGMHHKPELLKNDHYPYPLAVGNYWKYRLIIEGEPILPMRDRSDPLLEGEEVPQPLGDPTMRLMITVLDKFDDQGYRMVTLEKTYKELERDPEDLYYLVTSKRIYHCSRMCRSKIKNVAYLLVYMSKQTPLYVFPLLDEGGWGKAGLHTRENRYMVEKGYQHVQVPKGDFATSRMIVGSVKEGREQRYFVPGTGVVLRKVRSGISAETQELINFRLMP